MFRGATDEIAEGRKAAWLAENQPTPSTEYVPEAGETLHDFAGMVWWPGVEASVGYQSRATYKFNYDKHIKPDPLSRMVLTEIRHEHCQAFVGRMMKKGLKPNTVRSLVVRVSMILNLAERLDRIVKNPMRHVKLPPKPPKRRRALSPAKARQIMAETDGFLRPGCFLAIVLGLRIAEVCGLKWSDLDRVGGRLIVQRQRKDRTGGAVEVPGLKNGDAFKIIALPPRLVELLDGLGNLDAQNIVAHADGTPVNPNVLYKRWIAARDALGLPEWTFHDLRHGAAGLFHRGGTDLFTIRDTLGHSTLDMSHVYTDVADSTQAAAVAGVLEQVYGPVDNG